MRNCPMYEADHKEVKDKKGDQVRPNTSRRETFFQAVKREMVVWEDPSSYSDDSEHSNEAFMAESDDEEAEEEVTLSNLRQNLHVLSRPEPIPWMWLALENHCWPQPNPWPGLLNSAEDSKHDYNDPKNFLK